MLFGEVLKSFSKIKKITWSHFWTNSKCFFQKSPFFLLYIHNQKTLLKHFFGLYLNANRFPIKAFLIEVQLTEDCFYKITAKWDINKCTLKQEKPAHHCNRTLHDQNFIISIFFPSWDSNMESLTSLSQPLINCWNHNIVLINEGMKP